MNQRQFPIQSLNEKLPLCAQSKSVSSLHACLKLMPKSRRRVLKCKSSLRAARTTATGHEVAMATQNRCFAVHVITHPWSRISVTKITVGRNSKTMDPMKIKKIMSLIFSRICIYDSVLLILPSSFKGATMVASDSTTNLSNQSPVSPSECYSPSNTAAIQGKATVTSLWII